MLPCLTLIPDFPSFSMTELDDGRFHPLHYPPTFDGIFEELAEKELSVKSLERVSFIFLSFSGESLICSIGKSESSTSSFPNFFYNSSCLLR